MHVLRKGGEAYDFARAAVRDSLRPGHEGPALRAEQAQAQLRPAPLSGVKRVPTPEKPKAAPAPKPSVAAGVPAGPAAATEAAVPETAAPAIVPSGPSPEAPFHDEHLLLTERMKMAEDLGGDLKMKLFAAMAQTDCGACGWDCEGYAEAIATAETKDISLCVPGETETLDMLKKLMEEAGKPFDA
ncbi:MAG TPA: (Fe-S)-binding protein [Thermoanaerobaculia bacterium]